MNQTIFIPATLTTQKLHHSNLILDGITDHCAHCGLELSDSISIQSGLGPLCRKKAGYFSDPEVEGDIMDAMIYLGKYPEVSDFMLKHYGPGGARGLMNGLVKLCALNRKSDLHRACTNAIEALGFHKLASVLRKSMEDISVKPSKTSGGYYNLKILRRLYSGMFQREIRDQIPGLRLDYKSKCWLVPQSDRRILWNLLRKYYSGCVLTTEKGSHFIDPLEKSNGYP